jgi:hypothetical protein
LGFKIAVRRLDDMGVSDFVDQDALSKWRTEGRAEKRPVVTPGRNRRIVARWSLSPSDDRCPHVGRPFGDLDSRERAGLTHVKMKGAIVGFDPGSRDRNQVIHMLGPPQLIRRIKQNASIASAFDRQPIGRQPPQSAIGREAPGSGPADAIAPA